VIQTAVESSNICRIGWENETLFVLFKHGKTYSYAGVPVSVYNLLIEAPSVGKAFIAEVRDKYPTTGPLETKPSNFDLPQITA